MDTTGYRTSEDWHEKWSKESGMSVYDPDGWDRANFNFSWYEELITFGEFSERVIRSTCIGAPVSKERPLNK